MDAIAMQWVTVVVVVALFGAGVYWLIAQVPRARLMRCPESGAVVFVDVQPAASGEPGVTVRHCEFWPERKACAQGCLARYGETRPGYRVNLNALRPFEPQ